MILYPFGMLNINQPYNTLASPPRRSLGDKNDILK